MLIRDSILSKEWCPFPLFCAAGPLCEMVKKTETEKEWFPMRVTYCRETKIKKNLDEIGIENFLPMRYEYKKTADWNVNRKLIPALHGLIFVRSTQKELTELKISKPEFEPLRYIQNRFSQNMYDRILRVPDREMENFIRVASLQDDRVEYLEMGEYLLKPGKRVRITDGDFKGAEGVIKRIKKQQCVVVQVEGVAAVAITFVPRAWLQELTD